MLAAANSRTARGRQSFRALLAVELFVLLALVVAPFLLSDQLDLITLITNMMILSILAISFDMCWGFCGICRLARHCSSGSLAMSSHWSAATSISVPSGARCRWRC